MQQRRTLRVFRNATSTRDIEPDGFLSELYDLERSVIVSANNTLGQFDEDDYKESRFLSAGDCE